MYVCEIHPPAQRSENGAEGKTHVKNNFFSNVILGCRESGKNTQLQ
jgi:hypothetical protein